MNDYLSALRDETILPDEPGDSAAMAAPAASGKRHRRPPAAADPEAAAHAEAERTFTLFLPLFDPALPAASRTAVAGELETLLTASAAALTLAERRFHAAPFPRVQLLEDALHLARETGTRRLASLLRTLLRRQSLIAAVAGAWEQIPRHSFPDTLNADAARRRLADAGSFLRLTGVRAAGHSSRVFLGRESDHLETSSIPGARDWLYRWTQPFYWQEQQQHMEPAPLRAWQQEIDGWKQTIMELAATHPEGARQTALLLKQRQMAISHPRFAAMSLSDLATRCKSAGRHRLQLAIAEMALRANPHDPLCHCQYADALRATGQFTEALNVYREIADDFPGDEVARCGEADVLRALHRYPEALACYDELLAKGDDLLARHGRAATLRELHRLPEALACCEEAARRYDDPGTSYTAAEILRDLDRLPEALEWYEQTIRRHDTIHAWCGKARVLRLLGRLPEALATYDTAIARHHSVMAVHGKACLLASMGQCSEALALLPSRALNAEEWIGCQHRALILLKLGRTGEACDIFQAALHAELPSRHDNHLRTGLALCHLFHHQAGPALDLLPLTAGGRLRHLIPLLRAHALGENNDPPACEQTISPVIAHASSQYRPVAREILQRYTLQRPEHPLEWLWQEEVQLALTL